MHFDEDDVKMTFRSSSERKLHVKSTGRKKAIMTVIIALIIGHAAPVDGELAADSMTASSQALKDPMAVSSRALKGPQFDINLAGNMTAQLGSRAHLHCTVHHLREKSVSWVRNRDSHILTIDRYTFIADDRFQCLHAEDTNTWTLQISYVQSSDAGSYECQVSTQPKMSHYIILAVIVPHVEIVGGERERYVNLGSLVHIICSVSNTIESPAFVFWHHNGEVLAADSRRVSVELLASHEDEPGTSSTLTIDGVRSTDSGTYTCTPSNLPPVTVTLHVIDGEHHAAMHDGVSGSTCRRPLMTYSGALMTLLCLLLGEIHLAGAAVT